MITTYDNLLLNLIKPKLPLEIVGRQKMSLQAEQDANAESNSTATAVSRTISKSSHLYKNSSWDLVDAEERDDFKFSDLIEADLPKELKGENETEIKTYVAKKCKERYSIQKEIQALNLKRKDYILKHQKENVNALENAMINAIKTQAKIKNYKLGIIYIN